MTPYPLEFPDIASPCVKVCVLDPAGVCTGCGRTLDEIANWTQMSAAQRGVVVSRAAARRAGRKVVDPSLVPGT
jgi:uncharacterized protein